MYVIEICYEKHELWPGYGNDDHKLTVPVFMQLFSFIPACMQETFNSSGCTLKDLNLASYYHCLHDQSTADAYKIMVVGPYVIGLADWSTNDAAS